MACDILTTMASKATFNAGNGVIDTYCTSLTPETVQALFYGGDWCQNFHGVKKKNNKISFFDIILIIVL